MPLSEIVNNSEDELLSDQEAAKKSDKRGPISKLQQQVEQIALPPKAKQKFVSDMLETVIQQAAH